MKRWSERRTGHPQPTSSTPPLVLASTSPRRAAILEMLGLEHECVAVQVREEPRPRETPDGHVERLAREKALAGAAARPDALVIAGDTEVVLEGAVLGKPADPEDAVAMLLRLRGKRHVVHSGIAVVEPGGALHSSVDRTGVDFRPFDEATARAYVATGEPLDKAGSYGIQGMGAALVSEIDGDYYTVVGLPVGALLSLLRDAGWDYAFGALIRVPRDRRSR